MRVLVVDEWLSDPPVDGGSRMVADVVRTMAELGHAVTTARTVPTGEDFDAVLVSRPVTAARQAAAARAATTGTTVMLGHDLHHRRLASTQAVLGGPAPVAAMLAIERACWRAYDLCVYPSDDEVAMVRALGGRAARLVPFRVDAIGTPERDPRAYLLFEGGSAHAPNVVAIRWLAHEVLAEGMPPVLVTGRWDESLIIRHPLVRYTGLLGPAELGRLRAGATALVAPLLAGAGVKSKVVSAMASGVPLIATSVAIEGIPGAADVVVVADDADAWRAAIHRVQRGDAVTADRARAATQVAWREFGPESFRRSVQDMLAGYTRQP